MPRDLLADESLKSMPQLSREPAAKSPPPDKPKANPYGTSLVRVEDPFKKMANKKIHPFSSLLSVDDLDDCDWLEHAAFDPTEAASREKVSERILDSGDLTTSSNSLHPYVWVRCPHRHPSESCKRCAYIHVWCHLIPQHTLMRAMCALASPIDPYLQQHLQFIKLGALVASAATLLALRSNLAYSWFPQVLCNNAL